MTTLWSPWKAAIGVFLAVVVVGAVVAVVVASGNGAIHDKPFARGQSIGTGVGTLGVIAGAIAYFVQARRR
jgi:hypothetical protein